MVTPDLWENSPFHVLPVIMTQEEWFGLSAVEKCDMWCRWRAAQSLHETGRAFGKEHSSIRCLVSRHVGFAPAALAEVVRRCCSQRRFRNESHCRICAFCSYSSVARFLTSAWLARPFLLELFWLQSDLSPPARMQCGHHACHLGFSSVHGSPGGPLKSSRLP